MLLILRELIDRCGSDLEFFQSAYYFTFQRHIDVWGDVLAYRTQGFVPAYVTVYVKHVESAMH